MIVQIYLIGLWIEIYSLSLNDATSPPTQSQVRLLSQVEPVEWSIANFVFDQMLPQNSIECSVNFVFKNLTDAYYHFTVLVIYLKVKFWSRNNQVCIKNELCVTWTGIKGHVIANKRNLKICYCALLNFIYVLWRTFDGLLIGFSSHTISFLSDRFFFTKLLWCIPSTAFHAI